jgi:hypothetical protein
MVCRPSPITSAQPYRLRMLRQTGGISDGRGAARRRGRAREGQAVSLFGSTRTRYKYTHELVKEGITGPVVQATFTPLAQKEKEIRAQILKQERQARWTAFLADVRKEFASKTRYRPGYAPKSAATS